MMQLFRATFVKRHSFRATLWHGGNCSEPINKEVFVPCREPGGEAVEDGENLLISASNEENAVLAWAFDECRERRLRRYRVS